MIVYDVETILRGVRFRARRRRAFTRRVCVVLTLFFFSFFLPLPLHFFLPQTNNKKSMCGCWVICSVDLAAPEHGAAVYFAPLPPPRLSTRPVRLTPQHVCGGGEQRSGPRRSQHRTSSHSLQHFQHPPNLPCHIQGSIQEREEEGWVCDYVCSTAMEAEFKASVSWSESVRFTIYSFIFLLQS